MIKLGDSTPERSQVGWRQVADLSGVGGSDSLVSKVNDLLRCKGA